MEGSAKEWEMEESRVGKTRTVIALDDMADIVN